MSQVIKGVGGRRTHISSNLMRESLMDKRVMAASDRQPVIAMLPKVNIVSMGGCSIMDRGKDAIVPLLDEVVRCRRKHQIVLGVGLGARLRHTYHICLDLGIPTGGMAMVAGAVGEQNRYMVQALLAKHGGVVLHKDHFVVLPLWLEAGLIPLMTGMPPYHYWEPPSGDKRVPMYREDFGMFMVSETLGARSMIFVKDEDGLYTADPKTDKAAKLIPKATAREVLDMQLADMIIEPVVLEAMLNARHTRKIQIINGLKPGLLKKALAGEPVGTVITTD